MRYNEEPKVALFLQEDNSTTELVPEFLNVLLDPTLIIKVSCALSSATWIEIDKIYTQ